MIILGITGSIGMGKSAVTGMLERLGVPGHDADSSVHQLMQPGKAGYNAVTAAFPYFRYPQIYERRNGPLGKMRYLDRKALGTVVFHDDEKRHELESILHPLVRQDQNRFIKEMKALGRKIVALDIPLLLETDSYQFVTYSINVTAPFHIQKARVLDRPNMDEDRFLAILDKQIPTHEKSALADYTVHTGLGRAQTFKELQAILSDIKSRTAPLYVQQATGRIY